MGREIFSKIVRETSVIKGEGSSVRKAKRILVAKVYWCKYGWVEKMHCGWSRGSKGGWGW